MSQTKTISVGLKFEGTVSVAVPEHLGDLDAKAMAENMALARILAVTDNPDAPDEEAVASYQQTCSEKAKKTAANDWDVALPTAIDGSWDLTGVVEEKVSAEDAQQAANDARAIASTESEIDARIAYVALVCSRQLYGLALREMGQRLSQIKLAGDRTPHPSTMDVMIQAATAKAGEPFDGADLLNTFISAIVPWMTDVVGKAIVDDKEGHRKAAEEADKRRREVILYTGLPINDGLLHRDRPAIFIGPKDLLQFVMSWIDYSANEHVDDMLPGSHFLTVRLYDAKTTLENSDFCLRLNKPDWMNFAGGSTRMDKFREMLSRRVKRSIDLLIVEDIAAANTVGKILTGSMTDSDYGGYAPARIQEAMARICDWANKFATGVVGGIPIGPKIKPLRDEFPSLKDKCDIYFVDADPPIHDSVVINIRHPNGQTLQFETTRQSLAGSSDKVLLPPPSSSIIVP